MGERYMQTEGLSQHVSCQHCKGMEKPIAVVFPGKDQQRRKLTCFCTDCWSFTSIITTSMDVSFFKQFNPETGKFHRALSYADDRPHKAAETWVTAPVTFNSPSMRVKRPPD